MSYDFRFSSIRILFPIALDDRWTDEKTPTLFPFPCDDDDDDDDVDRLVPTLDCAKTMNGESAYSSYIYKGTNALELVGTPVGYICQ